MPKTLQAATIAFSVAAPVVPQLYADDDSGHFNSRNGIRRVLLISIDEMHASIIKTA
jgi:hypothetical protein